MENETKDGAGKTEKNPIAVAMGKLRWANKTAEERSEHCKMMAKKSAVVRAPKYKKEQELKIIVE